MSVVDGRFHASVTPELRERARRELEVDNRLTKERVRLYEDSPWPGHLALPRAWGLSRFPDWEGVDYRVSGSRSLALRSTFSPRFGQAEAVEGVMDCLNRKSGGILVSGCGTGKTIMGIEVALRLGRPTCVLVHKEFLAEQWEKDIHKVCPEARVGILRRDRADTGNDYDFVLAMVQSLTSPTRQYPADWFWSFGLVICDEVHRHAAEVWQTAIQKMPAHYRLGLTATYRRADGMMPVIAGHIGDVAYELKELSAKMSPTVHFVTLTTSLEPKDYLNPWDKELNRGKLVTKLASMDNRNEAIAKILLEALKSERKVFVLSERLKQLSWMAARMQQGGVLVSDIGFFIGGKTVDQLEEAAGRRLILATYQMAQDALNRVDLDTLFLITPRADVEQSVGRILRDETVGKPRLVVDIVDKHVPPCLSLRAARARQYARLGYEVRN